MLGWTSLRGGQRLAPEARDEAVVLGEVLGQQLDRDLPLEHVVERAVDGRHAAGAEPLVEPVAARDLRVAPEDAHVASRPPAAGASVLTGALRCCPVGQAASFRCSIAARAVIRPWAVLLLGLLVLLGLVLLVACVPSSVTVGVLRGSGASTEAPWRACTGRETSVSSRVALL